uniref:endopeptidase La n=1 Tax=viral metagenome TaxID=1070528 RepID=A0A6M3XP69_9ZZZZ
MMLPYPIRDKILLDIVKTNKYVGVSFNSDKTKIGTIAEVYDINEVQDGANIILQGLCRFSKDYPIDDNELYTQAYVSYKEDIINNIDEVKALKPRILGLFSKINKISPIVPREIISIIDTIKEDTSMVCDMIAASSDTDLDERQSVLNEVELSKRMRTVLKILNSKLNIIEIGIKVDNETKKSMEQTNREYYLRRQREEINKQLGDGDKDNKNEVEIYKERIDKKGLPQEALDEANRELKRMERMHSASHEYSIVATYLDWLLDLPWNDSTKDNTDISIARDILEKDHYGLDKPKKRILEFLAVRKLKADSRTPILCFVGPPGTGKTSLGKSIACAMNRKFYRMSLGGIKDEADVRGFRRTYLGSMPGRIIQSIKRAGSNNPLVMLDEIDKIGSDHRGGDPASALLEALDPEQNYSFVDHYINVPFDLSKIFFITTANTLSTIQPALRDRMEIIELHGYSQYEKLKIANGFLIPRQIKEHGLNDSQIEFTEDSLGEIINAYTLEAGVRNLEREIANICRGVATEIVDNKIESEKINRDIVKKYLDVPKFKTISDIEITKPGLSTVLYASSLGGGIDLVETVKFKKEGKLQRVITSGSLGDVIKESVGVALSWIKENRPLLAEKITEYDIHVHFPSGATPKDGPSAGIALVTALVSLFTDKKIKSNLAMTGEMTLRGKVLEIGGIKHKMLAAHRASVTDVILPKWNKKDIGELPMDLHKDISFHFVDSIEDVLNIAFDNI